MEPSQEQLTAESNHLWLQKGLSWMLKEVLNPAIATLLKNELTLY